MHFSLRLLKVLSIIHSSVFSLETKCICDATRPLYTHFTHVIMYVHTYVCTHTLHTLMYTHSCVYVYMFKGRGRQEAWCACGAG